MKTDEVISPKLNASHNLMVRNVLLRHLNTAYYCKLHIVAFLMQVQSKTQLKELQDVIESYNTALSSKIKQLEDLFAFLDEQPSEVAVAGIKSMTLEALFAIIKQSRVPYEKELTILNYLRLVNAIDTCHVQILNQMTKAIGIPKTYLLGTLSANRANIEALEKIAQKYLSNS